MAFYRCPRCHEWFMETYCRLCDDYLCQRCCDIEESSALDAMDEEGEWN